MTYIPKFPMERDKVVSDKDKVLAKWPDARCMWSIAGYRIVRRPEYHNIYLTDKLTTEPEAWADAARRADAERYTYLKLRIPPGEWRTLLVTPCGQWDAKIDAARKEEG